MVPVNDEVANLVKLFHEKYKEDPIRFDDLPGTTSHWNAIKLVKLFEMVSSNAELEGEEPEDDESDGMLTHDDMAGQLGLERSTITRKVGSTDWAYFHKRLSELCHMTHEEYVEAAAESFRINSLAREGIRQRKNEISRTAFMRHIEERIMTSATPAKRVSLPPIRLKPKAKNRTPEHMVLLLSDQHVGLEFSKEETGGLNEYNLEVYKNRVANLRQALIEIFRLHTELYSLPVLHVLGLGDCVQGTNMGGEWGPAYNSSLSVYDQAFMAADTTSQLLETWSNYFEQIKFMGVVGNHGRAGVSKNSDRVTANWDNVVYSLLKKSMEKHKNVDINFSKSWWAQTNINGTEFMLVHGDHVRNNINSLHTEEQRIQSLVAQKYKPFNILVAGHFHTHVEVETTNGKVILNGSFIGGDVYSMSHLKARSRPTQTIMGVHPEHGITWKYCLDLDHQRTQ